MLFSYRAISSDGLRVHGQIEARDAADLESRLAAMQLEMVSSKPIHPARWFARRSIPRSELINFCFHLEQLSRAGVPLLEGLADLRDSLDHAPFRAVVSSLGQRIESGETLSQAMASHSEAFNAIFIHLIKAGECSGQIPEILANLTESLKWEDELAAQTRKILLYPFFVGVIVLAVSIFLMIFLVPQLKIFVKNMGQELPIHTRLLFFVSETLSSYGLWLAAIVAVCFLSTAIIYRRNPAWRLQLDAVKIRLPVTGPILKKIILARFSGLFAMLYAAGIPVLQALQSTHGVIGNQLIANALHVADKNVQEGRSLSEAFRQTGLFPPLLVRMLHVGEITGELDQAMRNVAYFYQRDIRESVGKAQTLIEPLLTVLMGLLLGWIMLAVIGPIYDVISRIKL